MTGPLDPAFAPLLADPRSAMRPPRADQPLAEYRQRLEAPMMEAVGPSVKSVETFDGAAIGLAVAVRVYTPFESPVGTTLFIHGGGFVIGSLDTHDALCRSLAIASAARVVAVDYRLAPEAPYPAGPDDCRAALRWAAAHFSGDGPLALCGDSAGGHLAVGVARHAAATGMKIAALALLYPVADPALVSGSWDQFGTGHVLTRAWMAWAWSAYLGGRNTADPSFTLRLADLGGLPPTYIVTAEHDPLRDEGKALGAAIFAAGSQARVTTACGMIHGFASLPMLTPAADLAIRDIGEHIRQHLC